ncbi:MAG: hypothetical protein CBD74_04850, partial [Saprospirales bacterium TMED214]
RRFHNSLPSRRADEWRTNTIASKPTRVRNYGGELPPNTQSHALTTSQNRFEGSIKVKNEVIFRQGFFTKQGACLMKWPRMPYR